MFILHFRLEGKSKEMLENIVEEGAEDLPEDKLETKHSFQVLQG